jgi:hypothetical protein
LDGSKHLVYFLTHPYFVSMSAKVVCIYLRLVVIFLNIAIAHFS